MKKLLPTAALLLAATLAAPAHAQFAKAEDAIQYRQGAFRVLGHHFGRLGAMANGKMPYNAATAAADGDVIAAVAKLPVTGFVPGSETGHGAVERAAQGEGIERQDGRRNRQAGRGRQERQPGSAESRLWPRRADVQGVP